METPLPDKSGLSDGTVLPDEGVNPVTDGRLIIVLTQKIYF